MSYADDFEDIGGILSEQDSYIEDCEEYEGNCRRCPNKYNCWSSTYRNRGKGRWQSVN